MADVRAVLEEASVKMQRVFTKRYVQIRRELNRSLNYSNNPDFALISLYFLYKFISSVIADLNHDIENQISDQLEFAYYLGFALGLMSYYDSMGISYTFKAVMLEVSTMVEKSVLIEMKKVTMNDLLQVTRNTEFVVKKYIQDTLNKHLTIKNMQNMGRTDLSSLLINELTGKQLKNAIEDNMIAIVDKAGRRWKVESYVDMVVQTKAHQVYVQGLQDFAKKNGGGDLARIPFSPTTTDACLKFEGMIISMTGASAGYRTYAELKATNLIFHPRCRHHPKPYWNEAQIPKDDKKTHDKVSAQ